MRDICDVSHPVVSVCEYNRINAKNSMRLGVMPGPLTIDRIMTKFKVQYTIWQRDLNKEREVCDIME